MEGKNPVILSSDPKVKEMFRKMIADTTDAIIGSYDDNTAYSGKDVYELRKSLEDLGFLPDEGLGFDRTLETVRKEIMPHLLRTWSTMYMPHLHAPALTETIASELIIGTFNDSMDSWDQGPAATEIEEDMIHGLVKLFGFGSGADGTFTSGGTQSNMAAIIAARDWYCNRKHGCDVKKEGLPPFYGKMRLYTSEVSHFSMEKSCHVMGLGYNCIVYDMRGHGEDAPAPATYGLIEGKDLAELVKDTRARYPQISQLGLHGESMGGSTTIEALQYRPQVDFAVSDCAFADLESTLRQKLKSMHLPEFLVGLADVGIRVLYGYKLDDMRPIDTLGDNGIPILYIHGDADTTVPPQSAQQLYDRTQGTKQLHYVAGANHAESVLVAPDEYRETVSSFLAQL